MSTLDTAPLRQALVANMHDGDEGGVMTMRVSDLLDEEVAIVRDFLLDDEVREVRHTEPWRALEIIVARLGGWPACEYIVEGTDTDGTVWYRCETHDELAPSPYAPCAKA